MKIQSPNARVEFGHVHPGMTIKDSHGDYFLVSDNRSAVRLKDGFTVDFYDSAMVTVAPGYFTPTGWEGP